MRTTTAPARRSNTRSSRSAMTGARIRLVMRTRSSTSMTTHGFYQPRLFGIDASTTPGDPVRLDLRGRERLLVHDRCRRPGLRRSSPNGDDDYEGQEFPDGVANIRVDQGWGSAQIMGAVRHINDDNGDGIGWAVGGGLKLGIPGGWEVAAMGGYSEGAIGYITGDPGGLRRLRRPDGRPEEQAWAVKAGIKGPIFNNVNVWARRLLHSRGRGRWCVTTLRLLGLRRRRGVEPGLRSPMGPEFDYSSLDMTDRGRQRRSGQRLRCLERRSGACSATSSLAHFA